MARIKTFFFSLTLCLFFSGCEGSDLGQGFSGLLDQLKAQIPSDTPKQNPSVPKPEINTRFGGFSGGSAVPMTSASFQVQRVVIGPIRTRMR